MEAPTPLGCVLEDLEHLQALQIFLAKSHVTHAQDVSVAPVDDRISVSWRARDHFAAMASHLRRVDFLIDKDILAAEATVAAPPGASTIAIRVPYRRRAPAASSAARLSHDEVSDVASVHCRFCHAPLTRKDALEKTLPLPSGRFDEIVSDMVCFEGPTAVPMTAREATVARRGRCLLGESFLILHPSDLLPGALTAVPAGAPPAAAVTADETSAELFGRAEAAESSRNAGEEENEEAIEVRCTRCELALGSSLGRLPAECAIGVSMASDANKSMKNSEKEDGSIMTDAEYDFEGSGVLLLRHRVLGRSAQGASSAAFPTAAAAGGQRSQYERLAASLGGSVYALESSSEESLEEGSSNLLFSGHRARHWLLNQILHAADARNCFRTLVMVRGGDAMAGLAGSGGGGGVGSFMRLRLLNGRCKVSIDPEMLPTRAAKVAFWKNAETAIDAEASEVWENVTDADVSEARSQSAIVTEILAAQAAGDENGSDAPQWQLCWVLPSEFEEISAFLERVSACLPEECHEVFAADGGRVSYIV